MLSVRRERVDELADAVEAARLPGVVGIIRTMDKAQKDQPLCRQGHLTFSTVASAKGY